MKAGDLTAAHVRHLEVRVQQQIEAEGVILARIVDADVEVQLLLAQYQPVGKPERIVPHRAREIVVHQGEDRLDVAAGQSLGRLLHRPAYYPGEAVAGAERPGAELSCVMRTSKGRLVFDAVFFCSKGWCTNGSC